jgi:hypothetical protein
VGAYSLEKASTNSCRCGTAHSGLLTSQGREQCALRMKMEICCQTHGTSSIFKSSIRDPFAVRAGSAHLYELIEPQWCCARPSPTGPHSKHRHPVSV